MDKSWMRSERGTTHYIKGVIEFVEFAKQSGEDTHVCQCRRCLMIRDRITSKDMFVHLINYGMMNGYNTWTAHGEESSEPSAYMLRQQWLAESSSSGSGRGHPQGNSTMDIIQDAFPFQHMDRDDQINIDTDDGDLGSKMAYEWYTNLIDEAQTLLYSGCDNTVLETILRAMQLKVESRMSDNSFNKYLQITKAILPRDNKYPSSYKDVKKVLKNMGLGYETIHACEYGCILYYKENKDLLSCPVCGEERYTTFGNERKVPKKTIKYFPLTPRLQRLYMSPDLSRHMRWHAEQNVDEPDYIRHPADGESWQTFDKEFPDFANEKRNVRLGLATDGFNPFGSSGLSHSTWPIVLIPYNVPPHVCMKKELNILCMLISGPKSPGKCLNVFMRPLIDELKMLWEDGVYTFDRSDGSSFIMKAAVVWTISDFPGLGMLGGDGAHRTVIKVRCSLCKNKFISPILATLLFWVVSGKYGSNPRELVDSCSF
ncbi:unnamed protein product [Rhodiola kirilowii]